MTQGLLADMFRTISKTKARFISIIIIIALGAGLFAGIKAAGPSMSFTAEEYFKDNNLMDIRIQSPIGLTDDDVAAVKNIKNVKGAMGCKFVDALVLVNGNPEIDADGAQISARAYSVDLNRLQRYYYGEDDPNFINRPTLLEGSYPTAANQCLVDKSELSTPDSYQIGNVITLEEDAKSDLSGLKVKEFQIVGIIESPYYISYERGNCLVGNGKIGTYIYIPESAFSTDYYSEIYIKTDDGNLDPYGDEYFNSVDSVIKSVNAVGDVEVSLRAEELGKTLPAQISSAENNYNSAKRQLDAGLKEAEQQIALYQKYADDPEGSYNEAVNKAAEALGIAESEYNGSFGTYQQAIENYNAKLKAYNDAKAKQTEQSKKLAEAQQEYNEATNALSSAQSSVDTAQQLVNSTKSVVDTTSNILTSLEAWQNGQMDDSQLQQVLLTLQTINPSLYQSIASLSAVSMATQAISLINPYLTQQKEQLAAYQEDLTTLNGKLAEYKTQFQAAAVLLDQMTKASDAAEQQLNAAYNELNNFYNQIEGSSGTLTQAQIELMLSKNSVNNDLSVLKTTIASAPAYLERAKQEYNSAKATAEFKLSDAEKKLDKAKELLEKTRTAKWTVYDRSATPGYQSYESAVNNVNVLANIFPTVFFIVAALVCFTTMSRMVEEERTQMGTLKALGYGNASIASKYLIYSALASIIGSTIGIVISIYVLPFAIAKAYSIMFTLPSLKFSFPARYIIFAAVISLLTTLIATVSACVREFKEKPAILMRPKAPKPGKRVFLEKIKFIWKRINFTGKVTTRNLFRKKSRFIMTVLGVAGCTALILASSGLYSSINNIMKMQYGENGISKYDMQIVFANAQNDNSVMMNILRKDSRIKDVMLSSAQSVTGGSDKSKKTEDVYLFVPKSNEKFASFIKLRNRTTGQSLKLDDTGAMVTEKFADDMNVKVGDKVWVEMTDGRRINIPVASITENYAFSYIYLTENLYQYLLQSPVTYNYAIGTVEDAVLDAASAGSSGAQAGKTKLSTDLMAYESVNAVSFVSDAMDALDRVVSVLSVIIVIFIAAAGLLAFIVLYNLGNINISERQRELATLRVLGFHNKEVASYVYRENVVLSIFGILTGILLGIGVHKLLLIYCAVDAVMFVQTLPWYCFLMAAGLTALFSVIVNAVLNKKMKNVNMVESLKAIE